VNNSASPDESACTDILASFRGGTMFVSLPPPE